jgi:hypothetical protein
LELTGNLPEEFDVTSTYETALRANASGWLAHTSGTIPS